MSGKAKSLVAAAMTIGLLTVAAVAFVDTESASPPAADTVFRGGFVYTVDGEDSVHQALAVRAGRIVYVGSSAGVDRHIDGATRVVELNGRMVMPGLHDGHMHPDFAGAVRSRMCDLDFGSLTVAHFKARITACLQAATDEEPDGWLEVANWVGDPPADKTVLDALDTPRPILVHSADGHTMLANSRALELADITAATPDPPDGRIERDASGDPTGVLQDGAQDLAYDVVPPPTPLQDIAAARAALDALRRQGVTTFMDAMSYGATIRAYRMLADADELTARANFAPVIDLGEADRPQRATDRLTRLRQRHGDLEITRPAGVMVRNAKLILDGVIQAPAQTAGLLAPYLVKRGTEEEPDRSGDRSGPVYWAPARLGPMVEALARAGFDPHLHAVGDRAVRVALNAYEHMRQAVPGDVRAAIAHAELVHPTDYARFRDLDVQPVMSFQWAQRHPATIDDAKPYLGTERFNRMEPVGALARAGARVAFGSDWPVDPLDQWFALELAITRTGDGTGRYAGSLNTNPGVSRRQAIRAMTLNAAYQLHQEHLTGSLERGKLADLIVLDRNVLRAPVHRISDTQVVLTMVGGDIVYRRPRG